MLVTVIADASWCPDTGATGYGYWAVSERGRKYGGGAVRRPVLKSHVAEMMAAVNGIWKALAEGIAKPGDTILVQTDCQSAIHSFENPDRRPKEEQEVIGQLQRYKDEQSLTVMFRHVKGHTAGSTPREFVNNVCDKQAKDYMRKMRTHLRCKKLKESLQ